MKSVCRKYTKHREDQKKALPVGFVGVDRGAGDLDWVVRGEGFGQRVHIGVWPGR